MNLSEKMHQAYYDNLTSRGRKLKRKRKKNKKKYDQLMMTGKSRAGAEYRSQSPDVRKALRDTFDLR